MTNRYDELIRSTLGSMVAEAPEPIEFDQLTMPVTQEALSPRRWPPVATLAVAFAAVLALVGGITLLLEVTGSDMPVATAPPTDGSSSFIWSRIPHDEDVFGGTGPQAMVSVTVGGPGFVAVGTDNGDAAVWSSVDGVAWSPVATTRRRSTGRR